MKNRTITVKGTEVTIATRNEQDFISLTDMVKGFEGGSALIGNWLRAKDTILFLGAWEQVNNKGFNSLEFEGIKSEAGRNSFFLSAKRWIQATGAIGVEARTGR
ncbi:MAG: KilA-N domain-containing protein [Bacteroidetes bacterium]|nr:KilA-N domain-containing protein [Bacteroidota bacterium]MBS1939794.1 KilA-N domain-containing protein [Bacteroidota bacterium]